MYSTSHCLQHRLWQALQHTHRPRALRSTRAQNFTVEAYSGKQKEQLLKGVSADNRGDVARILEQAERAETTWSTVYTDFYTPPVVADAVQALKLVPDILPTPWGGYDMAERKRIRLSRTDMPEDPAEEVLLFCPIIVFRSTAAMRVLAAMIALPVTVLHSRRHGLPFPHVSKLSQHHLQQYDLPSPTRAPSCSAGSWGQCSTGQRQFHF